MSVSAEIRNYVRQRAAFACEFCGVSENNVGGLLTIDHFQPVSKGGTDEPSNLIYACHRCNLYKGDYYPQDVHDIMLWNPRIDPFGVHFLATEEGSLDALSQTGEFSLSQLRLNRPQLIAFRRQKIEISEEAHLLKQYSELVMILEQLNGQLTSLTKAQQALLEEQQALLKAILGK